MHMATSGLIKARSLLTLDGVRLNLLRNNAAAGMASTVAVLVPGWCMPAAIWSGTLQALSSSHSLVALDPRGQGDSDVPKNGYHIDQRADDIARCIELGVVQGAQRDLRIVLVGWSLGALESLQYVHRHGEARLAGLVLVDSSVGEDPAIPPAHGFRDELAADRRGAMSRFVRDMFRSSRPEAELARLTELALRMPLADSLSLFPSQVPREHWRGIVRGLRSPLLYAVTPSYLGQAENLKKARPATQVEVFSQAGHALFVDESARFDQMLAAFMDRVAAAS